MKGLFVKAKQPEEKATAFKFSFDLGGDVNEQDEAPQLSAKKKKNNKKKKKKSNSNVSDVNSEHERSDNEKDPADEDVDELQHDLASMTLPSDITQPPPDPSCADRKSCKQQEDCGEVLPKSSKKNAKRRKAKKDANDPGAAIADTPTKVAPKLCQTKSKTVTQPVEKEDWELEIEKAIEANALLAAEQSRKGKSPVKKVPGAYVAPSGSGPHFLSAKDPELDEAGKLRCRYGMGRNLVAIGPAKVRDPNWLPPPPGLTRPATTSTNSGGTEKSGTAAPSSSSSGTVVGPVSGLSSKSPEGKGAAGVFRKKTPAAFNSVSSGDAPEVSHTSPFSFSFNGL